MEEISISTVQDLIAKECDSIKELLLSKNLKYGNLAVSPKRIFSQSSSVEQIKVRIDDKLSRIMNLKGNDDEDSIQDLIGYLILLRVAQNKKIST